MAADGFVPPHVERRGKRRKSGGLSAFAGTRTIGHHRRGTTAGDARACYPDYGDRLDIVTPESSILSACQARSTATATRSGTSMASLRWHPCIRLALAPCRFCRFVPIGKFVGNAGEEKVLPCAVKDGVPARRQASCRVREQPGGSE